jgi:hypothetical protein
LGGPDVSGQQGPIKPVTVPIVEHGRLSSRGDHNVNVTILIEVSDGYCTILSVLIHVDGRRGEPHLATHFFIADIGFGIVTGTHDTEFDPRMTRRACVISR